MSDSARAFHALFVAELEAFDRFAAEREEARGLPLGREDPDVQRLIEAIAYFSARTRDAAAVEMRRAVRRMAAGLVDDLLTPMPAMGLLRAVPDERVVEALHLPRGSTLRATSPDGRVAMLSTRRSLRILPIRVRRVEIKAPREGLVLEIALSARVPQKSVEELSFCVRRFSDYRASLALFDALEAYAQKVEVIFDPDPEGQGQAQRAGIGFGAPAVDLNEESDPESPLGRIRAFFHAPEQELFVNLRLPTPKASWRSALVRIHLDESWPEDVGVTHDSLQLFVVPVENRWGDFAEPILCDGTKDSYAIKSAAATLEGVELDAVRGVFRSGDRGLVPILPASLAQGGDAFELDEDTERATRLLLDVADAFEKPCKVLVDGVWSQPGLWSSSGGKLTLTLQRRKLAGVRFQTVGALAGPAESPIAHKPELVLDLLSKRARPIAELMDLRGLLEILGATGKSPYRGLPALIDGLSLREAPDPGARGGGIKHVYTLSLRQRSDEDAPLLRKLLSQSAALFDAWSEPAVEVESTILPSEQRILAGGGR